MQGAELQQHVQRQVSQFCDRVVEALEPLERSPHREVSDAALKEALLYASSAVDIAAGPSPEMNLLDLFVFLRLSREAIEQYWIPRVYGEDGREVAVAFRASEKDAWDVLGELLDASQQQELEHLVEAWRAEHPEQVRVEGVRLDDFSVQAGQMAHDRAVRAGGLFSNVKSATQTADQALLLAERGMFLALRVPFLLRMQARLLTREILSDAAARLLALPADAGAQVVHRLVTLLDRGRAGVRRLRATSHGRG